MDLLVEKYCPTKVADFIGAEEAKDIALELASTDKRRAAYLFIGSPGTGKTSLALALGNEFGAWLHHIPSQSCTVDAVRAVRSKLNSPPMFGKFHLVLVDEADQMTLQAQLAWLSILDGTNRPNDTIIIFTCNETDRLEGRFLSRCEKVNFTTQGLQPKAAKFLARVWESETVGLQAKTPNFADIIKTANSNIREALQVLQKHVRRAKLAANDDPAGRER